MTVLLYVLLLGRVQVNDRLVRYALVFDVLSVYRLYEVQRVAFLGRESHPNTKEASARDADPSSESRAVWLKPRRRLCAPAVRANDRGAPVVVQVWGASTWSESRQRWARRPVESSGSTSRDQRMTTSGSAAPMPLSLEFRCSSRVTGKCPMLPARSRTGK